MCKILCFLAFAVCCTSAIVVQKTVNRITAGNIATDLQFPYTISLQQIWNLPNQTEAHRCGGALITYQHVLTAASCTYTTANGSSMPVPIDVAEYRVYAGAALLSGDNVTERIRTIANYTVHPDHLAFPASLNDIAVITLTSPYQNTTVVPIPIAINNFIPTDFTLCTLTGWGAPNTSVSASNELRYTTKYIYSHSLCTTLFNTLPGVLNIHSSMTCAVSYDIISAGCTGDEGNALVCNGQLTGLLSFTNQCQMNSFPEIYTRVSNYTTWIRSVTGGASTFKPVLGVFTLVALICVKLFS